MMKTDVVKKTDEPIRDGDTLSEVAEKVVTNKWIEWLPRLGYISRWLVYMMVGFLSIGLVLGAGGAAEDKQGAIASISSYGLGKALLAIVVVGLVGYSLWGFFRALVDPYQKGTGPKALAERAGYIVSGLTYGGLIFPTLRLIFGSNSPQEIEEISEDGDTERWTTAWLLAQPLGHWLVIAAGVIAIIGGLGQMYQAYSANFRKDFKQEEMNKREMKWAVRFGRFGHAARGVVFILFGVFIVRAALLMNPNEVKGLDGALLAVVQQPYGPLLLGIVALGLISFGIFSVLCARWIQIVKD
ncbi:MAG: DUF1206 domain-containing protein [Chloroflexia bacterium]